MLSQSQEITTKQANQKWSIEDWKSVAHKVPLGFNMFFISTDSDHLRHDWTNFPYYNGVTSNVLGSCHSNASERPAT